MTWVKICGITRLEDARLAVEMGADALGFVFCPSLRKIDPPAASQIISQLPNKIARVGVFMDQSLEEVDQIAQRCGLDYLQFHGREEPSYCQYFGQRAIKAVRVSTPQDLVGLEWYGTEMVVLDTFVPGEAGGTGQKFPWEWLTGYRDLSHNKELARKTGEKSNEELDNEMLSNKNCYKKSGQVRPKIILAGGLNSGNVTEAIARINPFGVDVSSGIELSPGIKDFVKLKDFVKQAKQ